MKSEIEQYPIDLTAKKVLVTGGAGFIGSHLVDAYIDRGSEVVVIDDLSTGKKENINFQAKFYHLSVLDPKLDEIFAAEKFDLINHHAAQVSVRNSVADPAFDAEVNIVGSIKLLELAVKHGVKKFIFASSGGAIYGEHDYFPADESHPVKPLSPYGTAKLAAENYLWFYHFSYGLDSIILRYANVYGPRQDPFGEAGVVAIFAQQFLNNQQLIINGTGEQTRDFVYISDVVRASLLAEALEGYQAINIGTSKESSVNDLFEEMAALTKGEYDKAYGSAKSGEQLRSVLDHKLARELIGWKPQVNLKEGLRTTYDYFSKNLAGQSQASSIDDQIFKT